MISPSPPLLDDETDHAPRQVLARSSLFHIDFLPRHHHQPRQDTLHQNRLLWRSSQVRYPFLFPVLSQNQRLSLRIRLRQYHYIITFSRTNHLHICSSHPLAMLHKKPFNGRPRSATNHSLSPHYQ